MDSLDIFDFSQNMHVCISKNLFEEKVYFPFNHEI